MDLFEPKMELCGEVAQLGERSIRIAKAEGSNPFFSTIFLHIIEEYRRNPTIVQRTQIGFFTYSKL